MIWESNVPGRLGVEQRERMAHKGVAVSTLQDNRGLRDRADAGKAKTVATLT